MKTRKQFTRLIAFYYLLEGGMMAFGAHSSFSVEEGPQWILVNLFIVTLITSMIFGQFKYLRAVGSALQGLSIGILFGFIFGEAVVGTVIWVGVLLAISSIIVMIFPGLGEPDDAWTGPVWYTILCGMCLVSNLMPSFLGYPLFNRPNDVDSIEGLVLWFVCSGYMLCVYNTWRKASYVGKRDSKAAFYARFALPLLVRKIYMRR